MLSCGGCCGRRRLVVVVDEERGVWIAQVEIGIAMLVVRRKRRRGTTGTQTGMGFGDRRGRRCVVVVVVSSGNIAVTRQS